MVSVVVTYYVLPGKREEYLEVCKEMIEKTNEEEGCVFYDLFEEIEGDDSGLTLVEVWKSQEALDYHMQTAHFLKGLAGLTPIREERRVRKVYKNAIQD